MTEPHDYERYRHDIETTHNFKKGLLEELLPRIEREARMDMANEPSEEAVNKEIAYRKGQQTSAVAEMTQDEALVTRQTGMKPSEYLAYK